MQSIYETAVITIHYNGQTYKSLPLELAHNSDNLRLVMSLSEAGTTGLTMFKMPTAERTFMIFSREQLNSCMFEIQIFEPTLPPPSPAASGIDLIKS